MIAPALLDALREKDPGAYGAWKAMHDVYSIREGCAMSDAWVQAVLQDACQARGWDFTLSTLKYKNRCIARIDMIDENKTVQYGDSPTEALLAAYIGAL